MAEEILGEVFAAGGLAGGDGFFATVVDVEAAVYSSVEVGDFFGADEFGVAVGVEKAVA